MTRAEEIKAKMARLDALIATEEKRRESKQETLSKIAAYIDHLHIQRGRMENELAREEAPLVRDRGEWGTAVGPDGVIWKV